MMSSNQPTSMSDVDNIVGAMFEQYTRDHIDVSHAVYQWTEMMISHHIDVAKEGGFDNLHDLLAAILWNGYFLGIVTEQRKWQVKP